VVAVTALVCGAAVLLFVIASSLSSGGDNGTGRSHRGQVVQGEKKGSVPAAYVVQNGDTLTSIAHHTGVPVAKILKLNPGVDPQILISGEKLKLR
jgi:LysM repeat protein